jgi:predicted esterase
MRRWSAVLALSLIAAAPPATTGFPDAPPIDARDMARRMLGADVSARIDRHEAVPPPLQVDAAKERFLVAVPPRMPLGGYGLFVYISPFDTPDLPPGWTEQVSAAGMIAVSAARSGNYRGAFIRRAPLALMGVQAVMRRYQVNPSHVVIAGFSGGSRVALKLALAYPELFKGALLDAGTDVLGTADLPRPPDAQLAMVRTTRFAILAGVNDTAKFMNNRAALALRAAGITRLYVREVEFIDHDSAPARDVRNALAFLGKTAPPDETARSPVMPPSPASPTG